jgi:hypothetical protein
MKRILDTSMPLSVAIAVLAIIILTGLILEAGFSRECDVCRRRWAWWIREHPALAHVDIQLCRRCKHAHDRRGRSIVRYPSRW